VTRRPQRPTGERCAGMNAQLPMSLKEELFQRGPSFSVCQIPANSLRFICSPMKFHSACVLSQKLNPRFETISATLSAGHIPTQPLRLFEGIVIYDCTQTDSDEEKECFSRGTTDEVPQVPHRANVSRRNILHH
jgi:hypothetical protein